MLISTLSFLGLKLMNLYDFDDFGTPQGPPLGSLLDPFWVPFGSPLALFLEVSVKKKYLETFCKTLSQGEAQQQQQQQQ